MIFKKKTIYVIGLIVFTLILAANVALYLTAPKGGGRFDGDRFMGMMSGELPEGFDPSQMPENGERPDGFEAFQTPENGEMPEGFDPSQAPNQGERPEGFDPSQMPENGEFSENFAPSDMPENGELPDGFDFSGMPNRGDFNRETEGNNGLLSAIRSAFLPILIVAILGDLVCAFMLVYITIKEKNAKKDIEENPNGPDPSF